MRGHVRARAVALVLALLAWAGPAQPAQSTGHVVERVVDGDTVWVSGLGPVRLIGVDTPEVVDPRRPVQRYGKEASAFTRRLLLRQPVRVEFDHQRTDKYRRTLAYLYLLNGTLANLEIVRQGYGHAYLDFPFRYMDAFRAAEREAREAGRGLWADANASPSAPPATARRSRAPAGTGASSATSATGNPTVQVWVNFRSRVYHCPGTRYYGRTKSGGYMPQAEAQRDGHRAAGGRVCG